MQTSRLAVAAAAVLSTSAFAQFSFDEDTGLCRDAAGRPGLNVGKRGPCADLRGAKLDGASFDDADLRGARFDGASLEQASFFRANLRGASFAGADLSKAVLTGAKLEHARFDQSRLFGAHLEHASLADATLGGADLRQACLFRTSFLRADLRHARFSQAKAMLQGARWAQALVEHDTLPYDANELAAIEVQVSRVVVATH